MFLSEDDRDLANPNENYYVLTGMYQGKFSEIASNSTEKSTEKIFSNSKDSFQILSIHQEINDQLEFFEKNPPPVINRQEILEQNKKLFGE